MAQKVPSPPGLPLVGNSFDVDAVDQTASLTRLAKIHGPIFEVRLMQGSYVVCADYELYNELCDEKRFTKHPAGGLSELRHALGDGLFTAKFGEHNWDVAHRVLVPAFGPLAICKMFDEMHGIATQMVLKWARFGPENRISCTDDFTKLTLDTIALCAMGTRFNSFYRDETHPFAQAMTAVLLESGRRASRSAFMNSWMRSSDKTFFTNIDVMQSVTKAIIDDRKANPSNKTDLVTAMLTRKDPQSGEMMTDANISNNMITFLVAGHETTSGFLSFLFYRLMTNPACLRQAQEEVDMVIGTGPVKVEHMSKLPYVTACLREAIRLNPPAAASYMKTRPDNEDDPVFLCGGKYQVKRGTTFRNLVGLVHQNHKNYGSDAEIFRPERMLDENFSKLPKNAWKPFGNGSRSCIGFGFAWQESLLAVAMLLQNFDFCLADPEYKLQIQQTLTVKPRDLFMHATLRNGINVELLEKRLHNENASPTTASQAAETLALESDKSQRSMSVFFGGNMGTCESLSQAVVSGASNRGYRAEAQSLDDARDHLPRDQPILIIASSYEGQPPDNARYFVEWIKSLNDSSLEGVYYAVFGCGSRHWKDTFQHIPRLIDDCLEKAGAKRLSERGIADAVDNRIFDDFEKWEDNRFWPPVKDTFGGEDGSSSGDEQALGLRISASQRTFRHTQVKESVVLKNEIISSDSISQKGHIELQLPSKTTYRAGDYLTVLPMNPPESIQRVIDRFGLARDAVLFVNSKGTIVPQGIPMPIREILASYVELGKPATRRNLKTLIHHTKEPATKATLQSLVGDSFISAVAATNTSILDLLEAHPEIAIPFEFYLGMLPNLAPRQYSISSSPLVNPEACTLTFSVLAAPALANKSRRFLGVSSNYLSALLPGDRLMTTVQHSAPSFHLPAEFEDTPIIMVCAGTGVAPFRGFVQERAMHIISGKQLAPALLFMGCREPSTDALYKAELSKWAKEEAVNVRWAFSRGGTNGAKKKYVQERLWDDRDDVRMLFEKGANMFVCGSRAMADGVSEAMVKMRMEWEGDTRAKATEWFEGLKGEKFMSDIFD